MKIQHYVGCFLLVSSLLYACRKKDLLTYNTSNSIYFLISGASPVDLDGKTLTTIPSDEEFLSFGWKADDIDTLETRIPVRVTGSPGVSERHFRIIAGEGSTAESGKHYEAFPDSYVFPAGAIDDTITVRLYRTADMQVTAKWLYLQLVATPDFSVNFQVNTAYTRTDDTAYFNPSVFRIKIDDIVSVPKYWYTSLFGKFSKTKILLMVSVLNISVDDFNDYMKMSSSGSVYADIVSKYLAEQKFIGNTIYDEDGSEMSMGQ